MYSFNWVDGTFLLFTVVTASSSIFVNLIESLLPNALSQLFRFGKFSYQGEKNRWLTMIEIPKAYFKHFYVYAIVSSSIAFMLVYGAYIWNITPPEPVLQFLDLVTGSANRPIQVSSTVCFITVILFSAQCWRRFYETQFLQVFSSDGKINLFHYSISLPFYLFLFVAMLKNSEGFVRGSDPKSLSVSDLSIIDTVAIVLFVYSWWQQYLSNIILANLRKDKNGKIVTEEYFLPEGGWFEYHVAPNMFFEIMMYFAAAILMRHCTSMRYAFISVVVNQSEVCWLTYKWYLNKFGSKYPRKRKILIPFVW